MTLHWRLFLTYAAIILVALLLLAVGAVVSVDRTLHSTLDARLRTEGFAAASLIDTTNNNVAVDADDRQQFLTLVAGGDQSIVADRSNRIVLSTVALPPPGIQRLVRSGAGYFDVGQGEGLLRATVVPIVRRGTRFGTVIVWRASDWIEETDRGAAIAFLVASIAIAALTLPVGALITRRALDDAFSRQRRFTADASHELRAPLAVIRAEADLALRRERSPGEYRDALRTIASEADRLETLTQDLLSAARAESAAASRQAIDAADLARTIAERLAPAAAAKHVTIDVRADSHAVVFGDRDALERALLAVVHNALKFTEENSSVKITVAANASGIDITVRDRGPGFSPAARDHAFERFWRDDSARNAGGSGLGLAIAKAIVEANGGTISLANGATGGEVCVRMPHEAR